MAALAAPAWAPKNLFTSSFNSTCTTSTSGESGSFSGSFSLYRFLADPKTGELLVEGHVYGTCTPLATSVVDNSESVFGDLMAAPVDITEASCDSFRFSPDGTDTTLKGMVVDLSPIDILLTGENGIVRGKFCALAKAVGTVANPAAQANVLNKLLGLPPSAPA
jgi:hypothetical protein